MEELISLAQGDGGPLPADSNDGFGLFYLGGEKRMLAMDSKVQPLACVESSNPRANDEHFRLYGKNWHVYLVSEGNWERKKFV